MKIKLSKTQWEEMGKKAGWVKEALGGDPIQTDLGGSTFGPKVIEVTRENYKRFVNEIFDWRAKFYQAADELERHNPKEGSMDYRRMLWCKDKAEKLNEILKG